MKKLLVILLVCVIVFSLAACGGNTEPAGSTAAGESASAATSGTDGDGQVFGFVSKTTADPMFIGTFDGFKEACDELGIESIYRGTDDASAEKEIEIINQFISQGVDGIAVIAADYDALEAVLQQAMEAGINVVSVDSAANPASRQIHIDFCNTVTLGKKMFQSAAKICNYEGQITVLSGDPRVAVFADFEKGIRDEFASDATKYGKIELVDEFYYGYDLPDQSTQEANAMFKNYPDVDVVICPTTVAILAAAKIIQDSSMDVKVTGIGLPSEMVTYFDNGICPEMWLWDIYEYGYLTAYALDELVKGDITGATGETFEAGKLGTYTIEDHADGGTMIMLSEGLLFDSSNIHEWVDKL
jgi:rhamnose transport system substrate-binding protein